ncbi:MAG: hypothetical protein IJ086_08240 [Clostridium sp.]|nr:hypothetical protein [Clostridium sp.]
MVYKSYGIALTVSIIVIIMVGFANVFTIIEPSIDQGGISTETIFMLAGPILFTVIAFILYYLYERKYK